MPIQKAVKQVNILLLLLFNLCMNNVEDFTKPEFHPTFLAHPHPLFSILCADCLAILCVTLEWTCVNALKLRYFIEFLDINYLKRLEEFRILECCKSTINWKINGRIIEQVKLILRYLFSVFYLPD